MKECKGSTPEMRADKLKELERYDGRARAILLSGGVDVSPFGALGASPAYRAPYEHYEQCIRRDLSPDHTVLELGAGTGFHTPVLDSAAGCVVATDISKASLCVLRQRVDVSCAAADMEAIPFRRGSFDAVVSAGSLSYGNPAVVDSEILRVLKPGGSFMCVDSLNHNPVYRLNRWIGYLRGRRTAATIRNMPTIGRIEALCSSFERSSVQYFGAITYLAPLLSKLIGPETAARVSDSVDRLVGTRRSAFKFVLLATGRR